MRDVFPVGQIEVYSSPPLFEFISLFFFFIKFLFFVSFLDVLLHLFLLPYASTLLFCDSNQMCSIGWLEVYSFPTNFPLFLFNVILF